MIPITFDPAKRQRTLQERGLDFMDAPEVFAGETYRWINDRFNYGEVRTITIGRLRGRMVVLVWTQRDEFRHIISMRKANDREQAEYEKYLG